MLTLSELSIPFVKTGGSFIAMKGDFTEEIDNARYAIDFLGGSIQNIIRFSLPITGDIRQLVVIKKEKDSPNGYPRKYDHIIKKPLIK